MWDGMVEAAVYTSELDGRMACERLQEAGIGAQLTTDNCGGMRPHLDLDRGVQVLVAEADLEAARALLKPAAADFSPWTCGACGTPGEPGFDSCWQCGEPRG